MITVDVGDTVDRIVVEDVRENVAVEDDVVDSEVDTDERGVVDGAVGDAEVSSDHVGVVLGGMETRDVPDTASDDEMRAVVDADDVGDMEAVPVP